MKPDSPARALPLLARVCALGAWAPGLADAPAWAAWASEATGIETNASPPAPPVVEPMLRRRLGTLARAALTALGQVVAPNDPVRVVFASRHGDLKRSVELLRGIAADEPLSPTTFSLSVHNAIPGIHSIAYADTSASTAIAAGEETFPWGAVEAITQLAADPARDVVLVYADEPAVEAYAIFDAAKLPPHALALRFSSREGRLCEWSWEARAAATGESGAALTFLRFWFGAESAAQWQGETRRWSWRRHALV